MIFSQRKITAEGGITINLILQYAGICLKGHRSAACEDNLFCRGALRPLHEPESPLFTGMVSAESGAGFAVFDGSGRHSSGQYASHMAAQFFGQQQPMDDDRLSVRFCQQCGQMIDQYAVRHHISSMGTTMAALWTTARGLRGMNVGDSRCYQMRQGELFLLSQDHTLRRSFSHRDVLTQYLGMPEKDYIMEPWHFHSDPAPGDRFLLCTRGLTQALSLREISSILRMSRDPSVLIKKFMESIDRHGRENDTTLIVLCVRDIAEGGT